MSIKQNISSVLCKLFNRTSVLCNQIPGNEIQNRKTWTHIEQVKHISQQISNTSNPNGPNLLWFKTACSLSSSFLFWPSTVCKQYPHNFLNYTNKLSIHKTQVTIWTPWQFLIRQNLLGHSAILKLIRIHNKLRSNIYNKVWSNIRPWSWVLAWCT